MKPRLDIESVWLFLSPIGFGRPIVYQSGETPLLRYCSALQLDRRNNRRLRKNPQIPPTKGFGRRCEGGLSTCGRSFRRDKIEGFSHVCDPQLLFFSRGDSLRMAQRDIPFVRPYIAGREREYVDEVVASGRMASDGRFTKACAQFFVERFGVGRALMTPSCTAALEMAALLCDLQPGDEVILPSFTFVSTANAIVLRGAKPVFVDIRPDTLNIDDSRIEDALSSRTKAIFPIHYAGVACEMNRILTIAEKHGLMVVEDAAQGVNAKHEGRHLGSIAPLAAFSFHETKNYICGEGGALLINDPRLIDRAEILREKGTNRSRFLRGEVDKYTWVDVGSSYLPSEIACAFLYGQLEQLDTIQQRRRQVYETYLKLLAPLEADGLLRLPFVPDHCQTNYHLFHILVADQPTRDALLAHLRQQGIGAVFHYIPLHTSPMGERFGYGAGDLPITEDLSGRLIRLPLYCELSEADQARIVAEIGEFLHRADRRSARPPELFNRDSAPSHG